MNDEKQSAVEWLYDTIIIFPESIEDLAHNARSFKQAQQMEKEQILEAYNDGAIMSYTLRFKEPFVKGEQYYNETYGK